MSQEIIIIALILLLLVNLVVVILLLRRTAHQDHNVQSLSLLNQNIQGMQGRLDVISHGINERLDNAANVVAQVSRELGTVQEIGRNIQTLQDFLKSPKLRGNIGEQVLKQMLDQHFPRDLYAMQYQFHEGQIVDAIIKTDDGIIPIDAKFPMENYQKAMQQEREEDRDLFLREFFKDIKKHVASIAKKYILPDEGTVDFAIMYIPSEAVYYEVIRNDAEVNTHALERKILFVSPNSFYYFLRVIMMGMQGKRIADATRDIIKSIQGIQKDTERFSETLGLVQTHVNHSKSALDRAQSDFAKLEGKIQRIDTIPEKQLLDEEK